MEVFLRVSFHWDFLQLINGLVLTDFNVRPGVGKSRSICADQAEADQKVHEALDEKEHQDHQRR